MRINAIKLRKGQKSPMVFAQGIKDMIFDDRAKKNNFLT